MFSWKFSWLTVLILVWTPVFCVASAISLAKTSFGAASEAFDPNVTVPPADEEPPPPLAELDVPPPQAASRAALAPKPRPPRSTERRLSAATDGGTSRARYSASVLGRDMGSSSGARQAGGRTESDTTSQVLVTLLPASARVKVQEPFCNQTESRSTRKDRFRFAPATAVGPRQGVPESRRPSLW